MIVFILSAPAQPNPPENVVALQLNTPKICVITVSWASPNNIRISYANMTYYSIFVNETLLTNTTYLPNANNGTVFSTIIDTASCTTQRIRLSASSVCGRSSKTPNIALDPELSLAIPDSVCTTSIATKNKCKSYMIELDDHALTLC